MELKQLSSIISKYSPFLGDAVATVSPLSAVIIRLVAKLFGADPTNIDDITAKISSDPDAAVKLKQIEAENFGNAVDDRKSAREREEEIVKVTGKRDRILDFIAILVVLGYFIMCAMVGLTRMDQSDHDVLYMMVGQLTAGFIMVLGYYFGSSNKQ